MTEQLVKDMERVNLSDYLVPQKFRTVRDEAMMEEGGVSEIKVVVNMRDKFAKRLTFEHSSMLIIYGFGIMSEKLKEINKDRYASYYGKGVLKKITLNDCGDIFIMVFELEDEPDKTVTVTADEVAVLLNNCIHARTDL